MMVTVVQAKLASMIIIGVGSFVVGIAPACFVSRVRYLQQKLLLSCTLCFGGGVLLATSILHMLPETRESMPGYAELLFSLGFLLLYVIDECVHYFWGSNDEHTEQPQRYDDWNWNVGNHFSSGDSVPSMNRSAVCNARVNYENGFLDCRERCRNHSHQVSYCSATRSVRNICASDVDSKSPYQNLTGHGSSSSWRSTPYGALQYAPSAPTGCNEEETFLCHGNHSEPCVDSKASVMGLLLALTVHSVLEGLAIGLQKATSEVFLLVGAVASHKFVVGFCLGLELAGANSTFLRLILAIFVFSGGSAVGIGVGMLTFRMNNKWTDVVISILQGLAGGTLLYVTVSEILPRERARWHRSPRRSAGILQLLSVILGFVVIFLLNNYVGT